MQAVHHSLCLDGTPRLMANNMHHTYQQDAKPLYRLVSIGNERPKVTCISKTHICYALSCPWTTLLLERPAGKAVDRSAIADAVRLSQAPTTVEAVLLSTASRPSEG